MQKKRKKNYRYYTEVIGQSGPYIVKHTSKAAMEKYHKKLKEQYPYFRKVRSGKIKKVKRKRK